VVFLGAAYSSKETITIPDFPDTARTAPSAQDKGRARTLALAAIGWIVEDEDRAERYLLLTGLDPDTLRAGLGDDEVLSSGLDFLANHEPDLLRAAEALAVTPEELIEARRTLSA
jgi:hypothetical protein